MVDNMTNPELLDQHEEMRRQFEEKELLESIMKEISE